MWKEQCTVFQKNYLVVLYDIRGHGSYRTSPEKVYTFALYAADLQAIIEELQLSEKPIICGLSLGGMIAQYYACTYPDSYKALILCDTAASLQLTFWDTTVSALFPKWLILSMLKLYSVEGFTNLSFRMARWTRGAAWLGNPSTVQYEQAEMVRMDKDEWLKTYSAIYSFQEQPLYRITVVTTLIILGEHEHPSLFRHAAYMQKQMPQATIQIIASAGHVPNLDQPTAFTATLHDFIQKLV
jgi:pimeloyl-ACP methyl ester carboxylesterase